MWKSIVDFATLVAPIILAVSYAPQILSLYKTKNTEGISLKFWYILNTSLFLLFIMALDVFLSTGSIGMLVAQSLNLVLALIVMIQVMVYREDNKGDVL